MKETRPVLTSDEEQIYFRQIQHSTFGMEGQQKLKGACVFICRTGGLGGSIAMMLARAGIGKLIISHGGSLEKENLNRMMLTFPDQLGQERCEAARETLLRINPNLEVQITAYLDLDNTPALAKEADLLVDASPVFEERYLMNQEAVKQKKIMISAAMFGMEGYVSTIIPGQTPCLKCLAPSEPEYWSERCFPVFSMSSTLAASFAAMEVVKHLADFGETLQNKMLRYDLYSNRMRYLSINRDPTCDTCSTLF